MKLFSETTFSVKPVLLRVQLPHVHSRASTEARHSDVGSSHSGLFDGNLTRLGLGELRTQEDARQNINAIEDTDFLDAFEG